MSNFGICLDFILEKYEILVLNHRRAKCQKNHSELVSIIFIENNFRLFRRFFCLLISMEISQKVGKVYECKDCDYISRNKCGLEKHFLTRKHKNLQKVGKVYECKDCDYISRNKCDLEKHFLTRKHKNLQKVGKIAKKSEIFRCDCCNYSTNKNPDYNKHLQTRKHKDNTSFSIKENSIEEDEIEEPSMKAIFLELLKSNNILQNTMVEFAKHQYVTNTNNNNTTTNSNNNNNQFNLNFFLNETCKDAMNIDDFVNSLKVTMEDFETTGKIGYVEGITRIILNGLKQVDTTKRPIHCTDLKRETVYIKNQDSWEKENQEKCKLKRAVNRVARMNLSQLPKWQKENPASEILDTKEHGQYMKYSMAALGGMGDKEEDMYLDKIMKNVMKEVTVSKES